VSHQSRRGPGRVTAASVAATAFATLFLGAGTGVAHAAVDPGLGYDPVADKGSLYNVAEAVGAHASWQAGYTGKGIGVALIDTGVSPVQGLSSGNVVNGPDLSFDSQNPAFAHVDAFGHGTHMAGIIAGRDAVGTPQSYVSPTRFNGIAPDATLVNVKVGASDGSVDVSQVIAGIDWVVAHRNDPGLNIRVLNLSYGTNSTQSSTVDPLAFAVENAWKHGIVVVAAGGNDGRSDLTLADPASDPFLVAVGALDDAGTATNADDAVPSWSTRGNNARHVDLVAPGASVLGLRDPGSYVDERNPSAVVGGRFFRGSGTSQAAAVVSGEAALLLQSNPTLTPDQVKYQFVQSAVAFNQANSTLRGAGTTNVRAAQTRSVPKSAVAQNYVWSTGKGSLDAARAGSYVDDGYGAITGEVDIFGNAWNGPAWAQATAAGTAWSGGSWRGELWTDSTGNPVAWTGLDWNARMWRSADWDARMWRDGSWDARMWRDTEWSARMWRSAGWSDQAWA
jgi:serine protease AprX